MAVSTLGATVGSRAAPARSGLSIEVVTALASAEPAWRALEAEGAALPYQRLDWVAAYVGTMAPGRTLAVAVMREAGGAPCALLPVSVARRVGLRIGSVVGGKHANLFAPLLRPGLSETLGPERAASLLAEAAGALKLDALLLREMPLQLEGRPNPFAAPGRPSGSAIYRLLLETDGEATLKRSMSADARKKLRSKERQLAAIGRLETRRARSPAEVDLLLDAFFRQKGDRFRQLGIPDPFGEPGIPEFLRRACLAGLDRDAPAIELYGLMLDERPLAVFGGAASTERLSGMFISFDPGELSRHSPGDLLVTAIVRRQCELGRRVFDLGVGEARYKRGICDGKEEVVNLDLALTARGRAYVALAGMADDLRRRLKESERAMKVLGAVRRVKARFAG